MFNLFSQCHVGLFYYNSFKFHLFFSFYFILSKSIFYFFILSYIIFNFLEDCIEFNVLTFI